jgi:hypothetical protein
MKRSLIIFGLGLTVVSVFAGDIVVQNTSITDSAIISGNGSNVVIRNSSAGKSVNVNSSGSSGSIYINGMSIVTSKGDVDMVIPSSVKRIRVKQENGSWVQIYPVKGN